MSMSNHVRMILIISSASVMASPVVIVIDDEKEKAQATTNLDALVGEMKEQQLPSLYEETFIDKKMKWKKPRWQR